MKWLIPVLLLLCTKTLSAQHLYYGADLGYESYTFSNPTFNSSSLSLGLSADYLFKKSIFGAEGNVYLFTASPWSAEGINGYTYALAPYLFVVVAQHQPFSILFKAGYFYSGNFNSTPAPSSDNGPSVGFFSFYKVDPTFNLGIDLSLFFGQKFYTFQDPGVPNSYTSSQLFTFNLSVKALFR